MRSPLVAFTLTLTLSGMGCLGDMPTSGEPIADAVGSDRSEPPPPPSSGESGASNLVIVGAPPLTAVGAQFFLQARLGSKSASWAARAPVAWVSSDHSVATVQEAALEGPSMALITVTGEGAVTITATAEGVTGTHRLIAVPSEPALSDRLRIESFRVVELALEDVSTAGVRWFYAPLLVVSDRSGAGAHVYGVRVFVPGIGQMACWSFRAVQTAGGAPLFHETYGDYELTLDRPGYRAVPGDATAVVYFLDDRGVSGKAMASGPVVAGGYPKTYTGGPIEGPWQCGP